MIFLCCNMSSDQQTKVINVLLWNITYLSLCNVSHSLHTLQLLHVAWKRQFKLSENSSFLVLFKCSLLICVSKHRLFVGLCVSCLFWFWIWLPVLGLFWLVLTSFDSCLPLLTSCFCIYKTTELHLLASLSPLSLNCNTLQSRKHLFRIVPTVS